MRRIVNKALLITLKVAVIGFSCIASILAAGAAAFPEWQAGSWAIKAGTSALIFAAATVAWCIYNTGALLKDINYKPLARSDKKALYTTILKQAVTRIPYLMFILSGSALLGSQKTAAALAVGIVPIAIFFAYMRIEITYIANALLDLGFAKAFPAAPAVKKNNGRQRLIDKIAAMKGSIRDHELATDIDTIAVLHEKLEVIFKEKPERSARHAAFVNQSMLFFTNSLEVYDEAEDTGLSMAEAESMMENTRKLAKDIICAFENILKTAYSNKLIKEDAAIEAVRNDMRARGLIK